MGALFTNRLDHLYRSLVRPLYAWGIVGAPAAIIQIAAFLRDNLATPQLQEKWKIISFLPHWSGESWAIVWSIVVLLVLFEGSFRVRLEAEKERNDLSEKLTAVGIDRCLTFKNIDVLFERGVGTQIYIKRLSILYENLSDKIIFYNFKYLSTELNHCEIPFMLPAQAGASGFIHAKQAQAYSGNLSAPFVVSSFPLSVIVNFEIEYDNVPSILKRTTSRRVETTFDSIEPLLWRSLILAQEER